MLLVLSDSNRISDNGRDTEIQQWVKAFKAVKGVIHLRIVPPNIVVIEDIDRGAENIIAGSPESRTHANFFPHEDPR